MLSWRLTEVTEQVTSHHTVMRVTDRVCRAVIINPQSAITPALRRPRTSLARSVESIAKPA